MLSAIVGFLILRRRGVYFSLLTLALAALTYTIAFRWTEVTGGEDGPGGLARGRLGPIDLDDALVYYIVVAGSGSACCTPCCASSRSPFGHVLVAIRENQVRAIVPGLSGRALQARGVRPLGGGDRTRRRFARVPELPRLGGRNLGRLLRRAAGDGGDRRHAPILGPAPGVLFYILFRELFSIWTANWLLWFGIVFVGFVLYSPSGLVGIWATLRRALAPAAGGGGGDERAPDLRGPAAAGVPASRRVAGTVLQVDAVSKHFDGIRAVSNASLAVAGRSMP